MPVGEISAGIEGPYGLYVDAQHALYVANQKNNTVTKYPYGTTSPSVTYSAQLKRRSTHWSIAMETFSLVTPITAPLSST